LKANVDDNFVLSGCIGWLWLTNINLWLWVVFFDWIDFIWFSIILKQLQWWMMRSWYWRV